MALQALSRRDVSLRYPATLVQIIVLTAGAFLGGLFAYWIANIAAVHMESHHLSGYADQLVGHGQVLGREARMSIAKIADSPLLPCSQRDIEAMRNIVLGSEYLRDAGRLSEGKLACSAMLGRLDAPVPIPAPDIVAGVARTWTTNWPLLSNGMQGHMIESRGAWVAINDQTLQDHEQSPPRLATGLLYDRSKQRMLPVFGPRVPLTVDEIAAGRLIERDGVLYKPLCRPRSIVCAVASESKTAILGVGWPSLPIKMALGGVIGTLIAAVAVLFQLRWQSLEVQLRKAVMKGELSLVYQPIVDLETENIVGVEVLSRWVKKNGESVPPDVFIGLAEENGFVGEITHLVMHRVTEDLGDILSQSKFRVNINITVQDLNDHQFLRKLEVCFDSAGIPRSNLGLELTERSTADPVVATQALAQLKEAGYAIHIDDFGTGYSSLAYLHRLAIDAIKIDRVFTQTVGTAAVTSSVVPQILAMAQQLHLQVLVEGIETKEQAQYFREACPGGQGQGWLYSPPVPPDELRKLLQRCWQVASWREAVELSPTVHL